MSTNFNESDLMDFDVPDFVTEPDQTDTFDTAVDGAGESFSGELFSTSTDLHDAHLETLEVLSGAPTVDDAPSDQPGLPDLPDLSGFPLPVPEPELDFGPKSEPDPVPVPEPAPEPAPEAEPAPEPELVDDGISGAPEAWADNWFWQVEDGYCGPSSAAQMVSEFTGLDISDPQQLMDRAMELGLMHNDDPSQGMTFPNLETLLEDQGVPCHLENGTIDGLKEKLDAGYGVTAMVDSGEIWYPDTETVEDDTPDHFLVVAGIDEERGVVILSDPGSETGNQLEVSIEQFENAWQDSDSQMLVSDEIDPDLAGTAPEPGDETGMASESKPPWAIVNLA